MKAMRTSLAVCGAAVLAAHLVFGETAASFSVDWRGLPNVEGIVRENSKANWGFVNFVAFGPGWQYTAQDYAAKEHRKEACEDPKYGKGLKFTAKIWAGRTGLSIHEEFYDVSRDGFARTFVRWTIASLDNAPMQLERAYLRFPLSRAEFAGGTVGGRTLPLSVLRTPDRERVQRLAGCDMRSAAERRDEQKVAMELKTVDELLKAGRLTPSEADERRRRIRAAAEFRRSHAK